MLSRIFELKLPVLIKCALRIRGFLLEFLQIVELKIDTAF